MNISVLVATMHQEKNHDLAREMNLTTNAIIINQNDKYESEEIMTIDDNQTIKTISTKERGLSKSRNLAIENLDNIGEDDIFIVADDDVIYDSDYATIINNAYKTYSDVDGIAFYVESTNIKRPTTFVKKTRKLNYLTSMKIRSVQLTFKAKSILEKEIKFNELFGSGAQYSMGEENLFLFECLQKKLKIIYLPIEIGRVNYADSTWFKGYNEKFFRDLGAVYYEMFNILCIPFLIQYAIRKRKIYRDDIKMIDAIIFMLKGRSDYKADKKKRIEENAENV